MADEPDSIVLRYLRQISDDVGNLRDDMRNVKVRITSMEENFGALNRRLDNFDLRLERIERRFGLVDAS